MGLLPPSAMLTPPSKRGAELASLFEGGGTPAGVTEGVLKTSTDTINYSKEHQERNETSWQCVLLLQD